MITFDFSQNLQFPNFGEEQPGDTCCFSLITLNVFGIFNHLKEKDKSHNFLYYEGEGNKGAINVASVIKCFFLYHIIILEFIPRDQPTTNSIS